MIYKLIRKKPNRFQMKVAINNSNLMKQIIKYKQYLIIRKIYMMMLSKQIIKFMLNNY